ncbi:TraE/TraK family type IV conjugative transfer system protein, partial [Sphingomonas sp. S17]
MDLAFSHASNQRVLRQRNFLVVVAGALAAITALLLAFGISRDREIVLQPVLRSPVTVSSAGVSREYLEMITRDVVVLTLDRSP